MAEKENKDSKELLTEIELLKKQVLSLEKKLKKSGGADSFSPRAQREQVETDITFIGDFSHIKAKSVNISEEGICFDLAEPLLFEMQYVTDKSYMRRAKLLWMKKNSDDTFRLGMHFENNA